MQEKAEQFNMWGQKVTSLSSYPPNVDSFCLPLKEACTPQFQWSQHNKEEKLFSQKENKMGPKMEP